MTISSAPLTLPGIGHACYDIAVTNAADGAGETVWSRGTPNHQVPAGADVPEAGDPDAVCSGRFGNGAGGGVTYVGTCDAGTSGANVNSVTIWIDGLYYGADRGDVYIDPDGPDGWRDPCGTSGCTLNVPCRDNEDAPVEFNLTLMRDAQQGFFDVAVGFEDVFCSAKADSCYDLTTPIRQIFGDDKSDPAGRDHTTVIGFACTAGPDRVDREGAVVDVATELILSAPSVVCADGIAFTLPLEANLGGLDTQPSNTGDYTLHYGAFFGAEQLSCGQAPGSGAPLSCNKAYYNLAIDIDNLAGQGLRDCVFTMQGTAQDGNARVFDDATAVLLDGHATYGAVRYDVPLVDGDGPVCDAHPLDGTTLTGAPSQVATRYIFGADYSAPSGALPNDFVYFAGNGAVPRKATPPPATCPCWQGAELAALVASVKSSATTELELAFEGSPTGEFEAEVAHDTAALVAIVEGDSCGLQYFDASMEGEDRVEHAGLSAAQVAACAADSAIFVGPADRCPCFETAEAVAWAQAMRASEGYDFRAETLEGEGAAVEIGAGGSGVFIEVDNQDAECELELEGTAFGNEIEMEMSGLVPSQMDACLAGVTAVKAAACTGEPGTCSDQLCNAGSGGAWQCVVCPCWDVAQVQAEAQALRAGVGYDFDFVAAEATTLASGEWRLSVAWDTQSCSYASGAGAPVALDGLAYDLLAACSDDLWNVAQQTCTLTDGYVCYEGVTCDASTDGAWQCVVP